MNKGNEKGFLDSIVDEILLPKGFYRKGSYWRRRLPELIQIVNLQKSNYSELVYLNLGITLASREIALPKYSDFDVVTRINYFVSPNASNFQRSDLGYPQKIQDDKLRLEVAKSLASGLENFFQLTGTIEAIRMNVAAGKLNSALLSSFLQSAIRTS